jgi:hypothetical protein
MRPTNPDRKNDYLKVGAHSQSFFLSGVVDATTQRALKAAGEMSSVSTVVKPKGEGDTWPEVPEGFANDLPSGHETITVEGFKKILQDLPVSVSPAFEEELLRANITPELSSQERALVLKLLQALEPAFAIEGQTYKLSRLGEPLVLKVAPIPSPLPKGLKCPCYPASHKAREDMRLATQKLLDAEMIRPSTSRFSAPSFCVYRNGKAQMVHDYRAINKFVEVPANPIPHMWSTIELLGESKYNSSLDVQNAFHCMELMEESKQYTAFATPDGLWEYNIGCFGLAPMPPEFQRRIENQFSTQIY